MEQLFHLLREGVTASHTIDFVKRNLIRKGFQELLLEDDWNLKEQGKYYVNIYGTGCIAFRVGHMTGGRPVFRIAMAHSDYPNFQIKPNPMIEGKHVARLNVEIYGGMYQKSWLDRPLGIAGRIVVKGENVFTPQILLYKSERPLCIIPSLAIHMDFELNKKGALDVAKELVPLTALSEQGDLLREIADTLQIDKDDILDYELCLYNMENPVLVGLDASMIAAARLDNLTSVGAILTAIEECGEVPENTVDVMAVFNHEEVGSRSGQGADSELLPMVLKKAGESLFQGRFRMSDIIEKSFLLSVDVAHAHHPNYEEKSDLNNRAFMGKGFCIKRSIGQKYGTTPESAAVLKQLCKKYNIPYTIAVNKTGIAGGSTLGPIVTSHMPMPCADIGMPVLAMHSASELGAASDYEALKAVLRAFYN